MAPVLARAAPVLNLDPNKIVVDDFLASPLPEISMKVANSAPEFRLVHQLLDQRWRRFWYGCFPLRVSLQDLEVEFIILNSIAPEAGLLGSALGHLSETQIERLTQLAGSTSAKALVVLMHHPVCAWDQEEQDSPMRRRVSVNRWALLAHETRECKRIVEILEKSVAESCSRVYLCGGHRHGRSRVGRILSPDNSLSSKLIIMESCALIGSTMDKSWEERTGGLLGLQVTSDKTVDPCSVAI
jgi:hypothetical protein